jgi:hypothetical protein
MSKTLFVVNLESIGLRIVSHSVMEPKTNKQTCFSVVMQEESGKNKKGVRGVEVAFLFPLLLIRK